MRPDETHAKLGDAGGDLGGVVSQVGVGSDLRGDRGVEEEQIEFVAREELTKGRMGNREGGDEAEGWSG